MVNTNQGENAAMMHTIGLALAVSTVVLCFFLLRGCTRMKNMIEDEKKESEEL